MKRTLLPVVAVLFAAFTLPTEVFAQFTKNINQSRKLRSVLVGGSGNLITSNSTASFIGGGLANSITVTNFLADSILYPAVATIGGGQGNKIEANTAPQLIGGDYQLGGNYSTIGGGLGNRIYGVCTWSTIGGGWNNEASGRTATISGGVRNIVQGSGGTISGGDGNSISSYGQWAVVGGGQENVANAQQATVGGGWMNAATGYISTIAGGRENTASSDYATVPGGVLGKATNIGSFVWSGDYSEETSSFADYSFTVRCEGGARFYTADGTNTFVSLLPGATDIAAISDSNAKTKVTAIKPREILDKLSRLPVTEWQYKHNPDRRYIGPMAQDFRAAFGLGFDDKSISTLDSDGVTFAAIQGLVEEIGLRDEKIAKFEAWSREQGARSRAEIEELKMKSAEVDELKAKLQAVEERLNALPPAP